MKRITITLPDHVALAVEREARRRRVSVAEVARCAFVDHLGLDPDAPKRLPFVGLFESEHADTAERAGEILAAEWVPYDER